VFELLRTAGAQNRGCDSWPVEHPGEGDMSEALAPTVEVGFQSVDRLEDSLVPVAAAIERPGVLQSKPGAKLDILLVLIAARQHAAGERIVDNQTDFLGHAERKNLIFDH